VACSESTYRPLRYTRIRCFALQCRGVCSETMSLATYGTVIKYRHGGRPRIPAAAGIVIIVAGCGHLWQTSTTPVPASPSDVYACAIAQAKGMGYKVVVDTVHREQRDVEASKVLPRSSMGADPNEFSRKDVMSIIVSSASSDGHSTMRVVAGTVSTVQDRRGPTDVDEPAGVNVRSDADSLIARCGVANPPAAKT
jgi:hypothetical protein